MQYDRIVMGILQNAMRPILTGKNGGRGFLLRKVKIGGRQAFCESIYWNTV